MRIAIKLLPVHTFIGPLPTSPRQRQEQRIFAALLQMIPGLEERLLEGSNEDVVIIADKVSLVDAVRGCLS